MKADLVFRILWCVQNGSPSCCEVPLSEHCKAHVMSLIFTYWILPAVKWYLRHQHPWDRKKEEEEGRKERKTKYQQWLLESTNLTDSEVSTHFVSAKALKKLLGEDGEIIKVKLSLNMPWAVWWKCRYGSTHFLTLALDGVVVSFVPRHITPWENTASTHWRGGRLGRRVSLGGLEEGTVTYCLCTGSNQTS